MKPRVAIIAALPREVSALVKGWRSEELPDHLHIYSNGYSVVVCAGMGAARAARAVQAAVAMPVTELISAGLAGACDPRLRAGDIVRAGVVIDRESGERYVDLQHDRILVTAAAVATVNDKRNLWAAYEAAAVDMEAATVARLARARGLKFRAIKAISDAADFEVEGLSRFATADGQFRERAFALHAAMRPWMWGKVRALAKNSSKALRSLTEALEREL